MAVLKEIEITAKTVQDAIDEGKVALGLSDTDDAQFEIIQMEEKKLFRSKPAIVRVYVEGELPASAPAPQKQEKKAEKLAEKDEKKAEKAEEKTEKKAEKQEKKAEKKEIVIAPAEKEGPDYQLVEESDYTPQVVAALAFLKPVLEQMEVGELTYQVYQAENEAQIAISGEKASFLIGRRGETMSALQYLLSLAVNRQKDSYYRIVLNVENYREKREKTLEALALRMAKNAVRSGRSTTLEPMNPYERRIIHSTVQRVEGAESMSVGEEPNRKVVIRSKSGKPMRDGGYHGRGGKGGRDSRGPRGGRDRNRESHRIESEKREPKSDLDFGSLYGKIEL